MDVWRITVAALRRWYVLIPLLALTAAAAFWVGSGVRPQYEVTATMTLVPGSGDSDSGRLYGNVVDTNQVLSIVAGATPARNAIEKRGLNPDYEVTTRDRSSIMTVTVLSDSQEQSLGTAQAVIELAQHELRQRQTTAKIPPQDQISAQVLQPPSISDVVNEGRTRNMAIVGILGAALSLVVAVLLDDLVGLVKRRPKGPGTAPTTRGDLVGVGEQADASPATLLQEPARGPSPVTAGDEPTPPGERLDPEDAPGLERTPSRP